MPARCGFVVVQQSKRRIDDLVAGVRHLHAEIDVVERNRQMLLVHAAHFLEHVTTQQQAGTGHRRHFMLNLDAVEVTEIVPVAAWKACPATRSTDDACMLERIVAVQQSRANRSTSGRSALATISDSQLSAITSTSC